jgi:hypothetical protein
MNLLINFQICRYWSKFLIAYDLVLGLELSILSF